MNENKYSTSYGTSDRTDGILGVVSIFHTDFSHPCVQNQKIIM